MRKLKWIALVLGMLLVLSGCEHSFLNPEAAMRAPKATGESRQIQEALEQAVGKDIVLKYPRTGRVRSAILLHDMNGDGEEEAFAFYQRTTESGVTRIHLLRKQDGEWVTVQDLTPAGTGLNTVEFADLDGDGNDEILTGWGTSDSAESLLCVYQFDLERERLIQRAAEKYNKYFVYDINGSGSSEIGIIHWNSLQNSALLNVLDFTDTMSLVGSVPLDGLITGYAEVQVERLENGHTAIYLDVYKGPDSTVTEVVVYDGRQFRNLYLDPTTSTNTMTPRNGVLLVQDINGDGKLDIPFYTELPFDILSGLPKPYLIEWQSYNGSGYTKVLSAWYCFADSYYLSFDSRWSGEVTVQYHKDRHEAVFVEWNALPGQAAEELLRIRRVEAQDWDSLAAEGYAVLYKTDQVVYAAKTGTSLSKNAITAQQLLDAFHFIG